MPGLCLLGLNWWPSGLGGLSDVFRCTVGGLGSNIADSKKGLLYSVGMGAALSGASTFSWVLKIIQIIFHSFKL